MDTVKDELIGIVGERHILCDEPMSRHTTMQVGGPARLMVWPSSTDELCALIALLQKKNISWRVLGAGSNVIASDAGLDEVIIVLGEPYSAIEVCEQKAVMRVQAGALNKDIAQRALDAGLSGYEFASGIPGSVGGAAYMNAGAYGGEFSQVCESLLCVNEEGALVELRPQADEWSYRKSPLTHTRLVIAEVVLALQPGQPSEIKATMDDLAQRRAEKQPLEYASAGSTFKRPEGYFAGKLIQEAGMQGVRVGGAQVSTKHAGFVVNTGGASAQDVITLIARVQDAVEQNSGVRLTPEPLMWGFE